MAVSAIDPKIGKLAETREGLSVDGHCCALRVCSLFASRSAVVIRSTRLGKDIGAESSSRVQIAGTAGHCSCRSHRKPFRGVVPLPRHRPERESASTKALANAIAPELANLLDVGGFLSLGLLRDAWASLGAMCRQSPEVR